MNVVLSAVTVAPTLGEWRGLIEKTTGESNHFCPARWIVHPTTATCRAIGLGDHVRAVERVVKRTPASVGGVERVPRVQERHDELRTCLQSELGVDVGSGDAEAWWHWREVADALEKAPVSRYVCDRPWVSAVPSVKLALKSFSFGKQGGIACGSGGGGGGDGGGGCELRLGGG